VLVLVLVLVLVPAQVDARAEKSQLGTGFAAASRTRPAVDVGRAFFSSTTIRDRVAKAAALRPKTSASCAVLTINSSPSSLMVESCSRPQSRVVEVPATPSSTRVHNQAWIRAHSTLLRRLPGRTDEDVTGRCSLLCSRGWAAKGSLEVAPGRDVRRANDWIHTRGFRNRLLELAPAYWQKTLAQLELNKKRHDECVPVQWELAAGTARPAEQGNPRRADPLSLGRRRHLFRGSMVLPFLDGRGRTPPSSTGERRSSGSESLKDRVGSWFGHLWRATLHTTRAKRALRGEDEQRRRGLLRASAPRAERCVSRGLVGSPSRAGGVLEKLRNGKPESGVALLCGACRSAIASRSSSNDKHCTRSAEVTMM
jgi:hypothetical protein